MNIRPHHVRQRVVNHAVAGDRGFVFEELGDDLDAIVSALPRARMTRMPGAVIIDREMRRSERGFKDVANAVDAVHLGVSVGLSSK